MILKELRLWYQETQCFYYSRTFDLTNQFQNSWNDDRRIPLWKRCNERFFWNRLMIEKLIKLAEVNRNNRSKDVKFHFFCRKII